MEGIYEYVIDIIEPEPGVLWVGTAEQGVIRVRYTSQNPPTVERFGRAHGLANDGGVSVSQTSEGPVFATQEGIYRFDEAAGRFVPDTQLTGVVDFGGTQDEYSVVFEAQER